MIAIEYVEIGKEGFLYQTILPYITYITGEVGKLQSLLCATIIVCGERKNEICESGESNKLLALIEVSIVFGFDAEIRVRRCLLALSD